MYTKILLPVDGSELSRSSAEAGLELARQLKADVVAVFIANHFQYPIYVEVIPPNTPSEEEYQAAMRTLGEKIGRAHV